MCLQLNQQHSGWRNGITLIWSNQGPSLELRGRSDFTEAHGCMNERKVDKNLIMLRKSHAHFLNRIGVYWAELAWLNHVDGFSTTKRSSGPSTQGKGRWAGKRNTSTAESALPNLPHHLPTYRHSFCLYCWHPEPARPPEVTAVTWSGQQF